MSDPILLSGDDGGDVDGSSKGRSEGRRLRGRDGTIWSLLSWIGLALSTIGLVDIALTWYPVDFGNLEWEFGTVTQSLNALPTVTVGLGLLLAGALVLERPKSARILAASLVLLAAGVVASAVIYSTSVPVALNSVPANSVGTGLRKAIARTAAQALVYPVIFLVVGIKGWKAAGRIRS